MKFSWKASIALTVPVVLLAGTVSGTIFYYKIPDNSDTEHLADTKTILLENTEYVSTSQSAATEEDTTVPSKLMVQTQELDNLDETDVALTATKRSVSENALDYAMLNPEFEQAMESDELVTQVSEVDWETASNHPKLDIDRLTRTQREALEPATIPVLLPANDQLRDTGHISTGDLWYSSSMTSADDSVYVTIYGQAKSVIASGSVPTDSTSAEFPQQVDNSLVSPIEGGLEVNIKAFGVDYNITVECFSWQSDPHCNDSNYILQIIQDLLIAGGKQQRNA